MPEHHLKISKTARVFTLGTLNEQTEFIWLAFHGYAQLAEYFIKKMEFSNQAKHFVIAPEGLSRFYSDGMSGRVGASWMTKVDRENEIEDYLAYIDQVCQHFDISDSKKQKLVVLGFSQGCATASRWANHTKLSVDHLIMWGGNMAKELLESNDFKLRQPLIFSLGNGDPFINENSVSKMKEALKKTNLDFKFYFYEGGHVIDSGVLNDLFQKLIA